MSEEDTKKLIITNYLSTINLGDNTLGVEMAVRRHFNEDVFDLTLSGCVVLAPIAKNPSRFSPISGHENNTEHWRIVLQHMYEQDYITEAQQEEALADDVYDRIRNADIATKGISSHYSYLTDKLIEQVIGALMEKLDHIESQASSLLYSSGLQIYTTQNLALQAIVNEEINNLDSYSVTKYSVEYRLFITHANSTTEHYSEKNLHTFRKDVLGDLSFEGLYASKEAVQGDIDRYKAWLLKNGNEIIGECQNLIL